MRAVLPRSVLAERIIPVARGLGPRSALRVVSALVDGGITTIEITVDGEEGFGAIAAVAGGEVTVGAGTVTSVDAGERAVEAGATFLVSPHLDESLSRWALDSDVTLIPGALTPTEIAAAWRTGVPAVKLFPASLGGASYLKAILAPLPDVGLIPTGGIDVGNARGFIEAGAVAVGVGAWLTGPEDAAVITERAGLLRSEVV